MVLLSSVLLGRAGAAQEGSPQHGEAGSPPAHEESRAKFVPVMKGAREHEGGAERHRCKLRWATGYSKP